MRRPPSVSRLFALSITALTLLPGCSEDESIVVEQVPKDAQPTDLDSPEPKVPVATAAGETAPAQMLAAIVPQGTTAWFFKLTGPQSIVEPRKAEFLGLIKSLRFEQNRPIWTLPEGWQQQAASGMRFATLTLPETPAGTDLSVISLPMLGDDREAYLLDNINRWRGQMGLTPMTANALHGGGDANDETVELKLNDGTPVTLVSLIGTLDTGGMTAGATKPGTMPPASPPTAEPASVTPQPLATENRTTSDTADGPVKFTAPKGWDAGRSGGMRKAAFNVTGPGGPAEVTVIDLAAAGNGVLDNVNRWRGQVGLDPIAADQLEKTTRTLQLADGKPATVVALFPPAGAADTGILGAMAIRGDTAWFIKMTGPAETLRSQQEQFDAFLKSVSFVK